MYGLPQLGLLAKKLLEEKLNKHGYKQSKLVPGLWKHDTRPIQFTLVVGNFGVKYTNKEDVLHLKSVLTQHYTIMTDWSRQQYIGITLDWDYTHRRVHLQKGATAIPSPTTKKTSHNIPIRTHPIRS